MQLLTLENWEEIMYSTMRSSGSNSAVLFFVTWVLIGKFTLLNLFLAVIMEAFEVAHERQLEERTESRMSEILGIGKHSNKNDEQGMTLLNVSNRLIRLLLALVASLLSVAGSHCCRFPRCSK